MSGRHNSALPPQHIPAPAGEGTRGRPHLGDLTQPSGLPDYLLDYAVAEAEGFEIRAWPELGAQYWQLYSNGTLLAYIGVFNIKNIRAVQGIAHYSPSRDPVFSSEIITRERIGTRYDLDARHWVAGEAGPVGSLAPVYSGPTPTIAALRCYIAARARRHTLPRSGE